MALTQGDMQVTTLAACRGTDMDSSEKEGTSVLALPGWPWVLGSHQAGARDRARGCSLPVRGRGEDTWRHPSAAGRADPELPLCSSGKQEGSVVASGIHQQ